MQKILLDTNILMHNPQIFKEDLSQYILHISVIKELDKLKDSMNSEMRNRATRALKLIKEHIEDFQFSEDPSEEIEVDDILIDIAQYYGYKIYSNDLGVQVKSKVFRHVECDSFSNEIEKYSGIRYYDLPLDNNQYHSDLELLIENRTPPFEMFENEILIIRNSNELKESTDGVQVPQAIFEMIFQSGNLHFLSENLYIENTFINKIAPLNPEQKSLFHLLLNCKDVTIICVQGSFGTGKSFILTNYALRELEKGHINKIIYVPNNSFVKDSREIAAVPGGLVEKELMHMGTLIDIIGIDKIESMINREELEITPISIMRGRNIENAIIYVNEAQNLTEDHVQLLIGRCGEGTRIFFDGDLKQSDAYKFKSRSGLKQVSLLRHSLSFAPLFGSVELKRVERSNTAMAAAYLNELDFS